MKNAVDIKKLNEEHEIEEIPFLFIDFIENEITVDYYYEDATPRKVQDGNMLMIPLPEGVLVNHISPVVDELIPIIEDTIQPGHLPGKGLNEYADGNFVELVSDIEEGTVFPIL
jgi:hypothetical protein